jgi:glycosyltransferase involved in cell wall biosynthesis
MPTKKNNTLPHELNHLIFCSFVPVGLEDYVQYFQNNFDEFTYLKWKFPHSKGSIKSSLIKYKNGNKIVDNHLFSAENFQNKYLYFSLLPFNYLIYMYQALVSFWRRKNRTRQIFIGVNYFCAFCGILLKKLGKVDVVIYRVMDFFPLPPKGIYRILNRFFYMIDKFCLKNSDYIWFTTEGHIVGREKYGYFNRNQHNFKMIPLGLDTSKFASKPVNEQNRYSLVYCGVISRYHMLDLLFEVIQDLKKDFNSIRLNLIGSGPDEAYFEELAKKMGLQSDIVFHGFVEEGDRFRSLMSNNILGIAFYRNEENYMKYTEPAKVKNYLSFGVPAIVSRVPLIANELDEKRVCFAVNNEKEEIVGIIKRFILDRNLQEEYKANICEYIKTIDVNKLLDYTIRTTFEELGISRKETESTSIGQVHYV